MTISKSATKENLPLKQSFLTADQSAFLVLFVGLSLLPTVSLWFLGLAPDLSKKYFLLGILVVTVVLWLVGRLQVGTLKLPWTWILAALPILPLSVVIAGLLGSNWRQSILGTLVESGTALSIVSLSVLLFLTAVLFDSRRRLFNFYLAVLAVGLLSALYHLIIFSIGGTVVPVLLKWLPQTLIGKWYEISIWYGFVALVALVLLEVKSVAGSPLIKWLSIGALVSSLLMLGLTNFALVWLLLGLASLLIFIYTSIVNVERSKSSEPGVNISLSGQKVFRPSFVVVLIAVLFLTLGPSGKPLGQSIDSLYDRLGLSFLEVRPTWSSTMTVVKGTWQEDLLLGVGPNNFGSAWNLYKPKLLNEQAYWNLNFTQGVGLIPTFAVTAGLLGVLAWLLLLISIVFTIVRIPGHLASEPLAKPLVALSSLSMIYFWVVSIFYTADSLGLVMLFGSTGLFIASLISAKAIKVKEYSLYKTTNSYFVSLLVIVLLLIGLIAAGYTIIQKFWSVLSYREAVELLTQNNFTAAGQSLGQAVNLDPHNTIYLRALANTKIEEVNALLASIEGEMDSITEQQLGVLIGSAVTFARSAYELNPTDHLNVVALGNVYEFLALLKLEGAYTEALRHYAEARTLSPFDPEILLSLARLEIGAGNQAEARAYLEEALNIKSNYTPAVLLLAQLDQESGGRAAALERLESAAIRMPNEVNLYFQLGFMRFQDQNYRQAATAFERVLTLSPNGLNANASYFLGLSYDALGRSAEALSQFKTIEQYNPDNQEIKRIIRNIQSDLPALAGIESEVQETAPIETEAEAEELEAGRDAELVDTDL